MHLYVVQSRSVAALLLHLDAYTVLEQFCTQMQKAVFNGNISLHEPLRWSQALQSDCIIVVESLLDLPIAIYNLLNGYPNGRSLC